MKKEALRQGQRACYDLNMKLIQEGRCFIANVLPTRYGKSDVMRLLAISAKEEGLIGMSLVLSPNAVLREQIIDKSRLQKMRKRYGLACSQTKGMRVLKTAEYRPGGNDETLLSTTIQFVQRNVDEIKAIAEYTKLRTGKPLLLLIDECHTASNENTWGGAIQAVVKDGNAIASLFTATPVRASGETIPGFDFDVLDERAAKKYVVTDAGDEVHNIVDVYEGLQKLVRLRADYDDTSFRDAWNEEILCKLTRDVIEVDVSKFIKGGSKTEAKLHGLSKSQVRAVLSKAIRDHEVIRSGVKMMLSNLQYIRQIMPSAAAIVFTGNDEEATQRDNHHARTIREIIEEEQIAYGLSLDCKIATMKATTGDERADAVVKQFSDDDNPKGDVLIVKQMAGAGLDCGRLKVLLDLSSVRTIPACIQRWMRIATPFAGMKVGRVIMLSDCLASALWDLFIRDEGGELPGTWNFADLEFQERYLVEKRPDEKEAWTIGDARLAEYTDSDGRVGDLSLHPKVSNWKRAFPILGTLYTDPQIAEGIHRVEIGEYDFENGRTMADEINDLYATCNTTANDHLGQALGGKYNQQAWGEKSAEIWNAAYRLVNWPVGKDGKFLKLQSVTDIELLRSLKRALTEICQ